MKTRLITTFFRSFQWCLLGVSHVMLGFGLSESSVLAQSDKPKQAVIAFRAEPGRILDSNFSKATRLEDTFRDDPVDGELWKAKSVRGVIALPEDIEAFTEMESGDASPFHYYFEFELANDQHASDLKEALSKSFPDQEERDGILYFLRPGEAGDYIALTKQRRAIMASGSYEYNANRFPEMTETAARLLKETQRSSAGVAIDFKGAKSFVRSAVEFGKETLPPQARAFLHLPEKTTWARFDLALVPEPEIRLVVEATDKDTATELLETAQGLVGLGKLSLTGDSPEIEAQRAILNSVKSRIEGRQVIISAVLATGMLVQMRDKADEARVMNDVRQISLSMLNFESAFRRLPFAAGPGESEELSWRVRVLPFIGQNELYKQFDLAQSWDSDVNRPIMEKMPPFFGEGNQTGLQWVQSDIQGFADITDGMSNTIAFIHNAAPVPWTDSRPFTHNDAVRMFLALKPDEALIVGLYDGSVKRIPADTKIEVFEAMLTPDGGEKVDPLR